MLKQNYNPKFASFYQKFDESKMFPSFFHIGIKVYCYKTTTNLDGAITKCMLLERASPIQSLQKMPRNFAMFGVYYLSHSRHLPLGHVSQEKCMLKCFVGAFGLSLLTTKVPYVSL
jgi:hypothetical protein